MNLGTLLWVSVQPVIKVILLCGVGVVCVRKGILDYAGRKTISTLAYLVFAPCLNYSALSLSVTPERLELWWPLIVNVLMTHLLGAALGLLNVWLVPGHPRRFRRHIIACSMFGNNGNLPLVIVTSLARVASQVLGGIDPNEAEALAVSYVMIGIIQPGDATAALSSTAAAATAASSSTPPAARLRLSRFAPEFVSMGQLPSGARMAALREGIELPEGDEPSGAGGRGTPHDSDHRGDGASHSHHDDDHGGDHDDLTPLVGSSESQTLSSFSGHDRAADMGALLPRLLLPRAGRARREARAAWTLLRDLAVNPNVMTSVLAIIVGCSPPLRAALIGDDAPLALFQSAIAMLGACCIPSIMIGLGATLAHGPGGGDLPLVTLLSSSVIRLMILPALGMVTVLGGYTAGLYYAPDAVFLLVMLIQNTVPTAIMVHTMSTVNGCCEAEVSTLLFWQYLACIVTIPPYLALYLWALSRAYEPAAPIA
ncbi:hypothetical protein FOA52_006445 [Chlamydomonas sp. UWO 241]|nr:hypothetical protein FOA52_006445 [Chlamydomonas sp. UWO 241]